LISNRPTKEITMGKWVKKDSQFATGTRGRVSANVAAQNAQAAKDAKAEADRQAALARQAKKGTGVRR
jgi:hypothetical protein